jgi:hypothetical protein
LRERLRCTGQVIPRYSAAIGGGTTGGLTVTQVRFVDAKCLRKCRRRRGTEGGVKRVKLFAQKLLGVVAEWLKAPVC